MNTHALNILVLSIVVYVIILLYRVSEEFEIDTAD